MATSTTLPSNSITINTVIDEKFAEVYTTDETHVRVLDNGRTFENFRFGAAAVALGIHSYSSGVHSIRIKVHRGNPGLGIHARNIPPIANPYARDCYGIDPSTYGFEIDLGRIVNGELDPKGLKKQRFGRTNIVYTLILNCDEHRLSLIEEENGERDEVEVDISHAPFPWCFFIALPQKPTLVSLI